MAAHGALNFDFPSCDIPINQLFVSVFVPNGYKYLEFFGIKEVTYFTGTPPTSNVTPAARGGRAKNAKQEKARRTSLVIQNMDMMVDYQKSQSVQAWGLVHCDNIVY
jgi:hypothetical protein